MTAPAPTVRSQWDQIAAIADEIERVCELRREGRLYQLGGGGSVHHKRFRFSLPTSEYAEGQIPRPGWQLDVTDNLEIVVGHDVNPEDYDGSWRVASEDVARMLQGLASGPLAELLQINGGGSTPEVVGSYIQQHVRIQYRYFLPIPEAT